MTTAAPGPDSLTQALIDTLRSLIEEHGNTPVASFEVNKRINMDPRRRDTVQFSETYYHTISIYCLPQ